MKVEFGPIVSDARNAIGNLTKRFPRGSGPLETYQGGIVASRGIGGPYTKARVEPLNPKSPAQRDTRASIRAATLAWQTDLTDTQRLAWNFAALNHRSHAAIKGSGTICGFHLFCRLNCPLYRNSLPLLTSPPPHLAPLRADSLTILTNTSSPAALVVALSPAPPTGYLWQIFASPPQSPGRMYPWRSARLIAAIHHGDTLPADLTAAYTAAFGPPLAGTKLPVQASALNTIDGSLSLRLRTFSITA
jgi:hypothetical protein